MPIFKYPDEIWGDLKEVEKMYREEKDSSLANKLNTIRLLMKGRMKKEVAEIIGVSVATISNWRARWDQGGKEGLKSKNKGRTSKVTEDIRVDIEEVIEVKREIDGRMVTGHLIHGYVKKNTG
jgi:transposase